MARVGAQPNGGSGLGVVFVLWGGYIGGTESFTCDLAIGMRRQGANPAVVFVLDGEPLSRRLSDARIPHASLCLPRGRDVLRFPRRFARLVSAMHADVAILIESGYLAAALRIGGYRGPVIGMEHGSILQTTTLPFSQRVLRRVERALTAWACSSVVAVSTFIGQKVRGRRSRRLTTISNGVDLVRFSPGSDPEREPNDEVTLACAARLIEGKGVDDLLRAFAATGLNRARLRIAGDGPERESLAQLASSLGLTRRVEFLGPVTDMARFWRDSDIAVVPSNEFVESFGMAAVEAMACGKPVVASTNGALPLVVEHARTGLIFEAGEISSLASALTEYVGDAALRSAHGRNGRRRCSEEFDLNQTTTRYLDLCSDLVARQLRRK